MIIVYCEFMDEKLLKVFADDDVQGVQAFIDEHKSAIFSFNKV